MKLINTVLIIYFISFSILAEEINVGFNQAWFKSNFGHQWTSPSFDQKEVTRILDLVQNAGSNTLRVWLFEGADSTALKWTDGKVSGLHPDFLKNFEFVLKEASKRGIQIYPTLLTPETMNSTKDQNILNRWWNIYNNKFGALDAFKKNALGPVVDLLNKPEYRNSVFGIDMANEIDSGIIFNRFEKGWTSANQFLCSLKKDVKNIPMTASIGWGQSLKHLYKGAESTLLDPNPHPDCVDFWDLHVYRDSGEIKNCEEIKSLREKYGKKIVLGEFGQDSKQFDNNLQKENAISFIKNAQKCGFSKALAWRLSDVRTGDNPEARHSYEAIKQNQMRPAYDEIKKYNLSTILCLNNKNSNCKLDPNQRNLNNENEINNSHQKKNNDDIIDPFINSKNIKK